ncbi:MAG TPA: hypothetical protein VMV92_35775 [Streptosporangiaceae bacterium]|nr:hypothetical protein [Streptosporangiaceae bacterium]HVB45677.1 hypothetical protein [Streptosporangiaceae bacterium]
MTASSATLDPIAREAVEHELAEAETTTSNPASLNEIRRRLPQANGDQDTW